MLQTGIGVGAFGLFTSTVFLGMAALGAARFIRARKRALHAQLQPFAPPVSLLKPLHGAEPDLAAHLATFYEQDYPGQWEVLFCARQLDDPGLAIACEVAALYPEVPTQFLAVEGSLFVNAKVSSLERMEACASHPILIISDSDVRVSPEYVRAVVADFRDPSVGAVTCLYRGTAQKGLWAKLEASGMSVEMTAGVMAANLVEPMQFLLGPTMAVRREAVARMGGFARLGPYCSDDFLLGNWIAALGYKVLLSPHVIDHIILNLTLITSIKHQARWMKSTRYSRPKGHFGTGLTFCVPFGLFGCVCAVLLGSPVLGVALLAYAVVSRMAMAWLLAAKVVQEPAVLRTALLFPLRDLMGFFFWAASYTSGTILWRGQVYRLGPQGSMQAIPNK